MPYLKITAEAHAVIESNREFARPAHHYLYPTRKCAEGFEAWFDAEVVELVQAEAFEGEALSDTIIRLITLYISGGQLN